MNKSQLNLHYDKNNFKVVKHQHLPEIKYSSTGSCCEEVCNGIELIHKKSGAKLLYLENNDPEKAFSICFKTPPNDSTGVFHILEHSVLCGSKKFPVKEPFTDLLKTSMQTFLNAMTFDDKTMYPIATTNEKDFYNLIDVYMDAVLFPNIYKDKYIFYQEGGHKTALEDVDKQNIEGFNGVVYNEMKGVYSNPSEFLIEKLSQLLFPDTCYGYSSGGLPEEIKKLKYSNFLLNHHIHYKLDNSYIIIYGDTDIDKLLEFLDKNYLSKLYEISQWQSISEITQKDKNLLQARKIDIQKPVSPQYQDFYINTNPENICCGCGFVLDTNRDDLFCISVLIDTIMSNNESPLKSMILKSKICSEVNVFINKHQLQPVIYFEFNGIEKKNFKKAYNLLIECASKLANNGIDKKLINASISNTIFALKENKSVYSNGIDYAINVYSQWLYDDCASMNALQYKKDINTLKQNAHIDGYFENLLNKIIVNNKHCAHIGVLNDNKFKIKKQIISCDDAKKVNELCEELEKKQSTPDSEQDLQKLPKLKISDINSTPDNSSWNINCNKEIKCIEHDIKLDGISYIDRFYCLDNFDFTEFSYINLFACLLGQLDTKNYSAAQIYQLSKEKLGQLSFNVEVFSDYQNINNVSSKLAIKTSCLTEMNKYAATLVDEILFNTKFDNITKIKSIINQQKIYFEQSFIEAGHIYATNRSLSYFLPAFLLIEQISGIDYYYFIKNLLIDFENEFESLRNKLLDIQKQITKYQPIISTSAQKNTLQNYFEHIIKRPAQNSHYKIEIPKCSDKNEAFIIASNVNYVCLTNDIRVNNKYINANCAALSLASSIISLDYLWNNVRVKNGAYGAGLNSSMFGRLKYYSYRDPYSNTTLATYLNAGNWLSKNKLSKDALEGYIISKVAKIDSPMHAKNLIYANESKYFCNIPANYKNKFRQQVLNTKYDDIIQAGHCITELSNSGHICMFGNTKSIQKDKFKNIIQLTKR